MDPFSSFRPEVPTPTPSGGTEAPPTNAKACDFIKSRVPIAVINAALANPTQVQGYGELQFPNLPPGPLNLQRSWLSLRNVGVNWHALYNPLIYKAGCP